MSWQCEKSEANLGSIKLLLTNTWQPFLLRNYEKVTYDEIINISVYNRTKGKNFQGEPYYIVPGNLHTLQQIQPFRVYLCNETIEWIWEESDKNYTSKTGIMCSSRRILVYETDKDIIARSARKQSSFQVNSVAGIPLEMHKEIFRQSYKHQNKSEDT